VTPSRPFLLAGICAATLSLFAPGVARAQSPSQVDLRQRFLEYGVPVREQGRRGTCSVFALNAALEYEWAARGRRVRLSEEFLNWSVRGINPQLDGTNFNDGLRSVQKHGICLAELMPYDSKAFNPRRAPSAAALADARARRVAIPHWVKGPSPVVGLTAAHRAGIERALAQGHPVPIGIRWPNKVSLDSNHVLHMPSSPGVGGFHGILIVGYKRDASLPGGGAFLLRNSWGPRWGDGGHAWITYAHAARDGNDCLWVEVGGLALTAPPSARTMIEGEGLRALSSRNATATPQDMRRWGEQRWSGETQLFIRAGKDGLVELALPVQREGTYRITFHGTRAPDYGKARLVLEGRELAVVDGFATSVQPTGPISLGTAHLRAGTNRLRVELFDKNADSRGYYFGIDGLVLVRTGD
jgi:hypothetical protein